MSTSAGSGDVPVSDLPGLDDQPLDMRLMPSALVCWAATLVTVVGGWRVGLSVCGGLITSALATAAVLLWVRSRLWRLVATVLLASLAAGAGFAAAAAWREYRVATHPLHTAAAGTSVTIEAVVADDPKPLPAKNFGQRQWLVRASLRGYRHGPIQVSAGGAVLALVTDVAWQRVLPGQAVEFRAKLEPPWQHDLTVVVLQAQGPVIVLGPAPWWQRAAAVVRARLATAAARVLNHDAAGLLPGLVEGDVSGLPDEVRENFQRTELTHLVAVSGTNVTIVLLAVSKTVEVLTVDRRLGVLLSALGLAAFVVLARPSPTVMRAAVMGAVAVLAMMTGRRRNALPALCAAVIGLLGWWPSLALDAGFAMSVFATGGLILLSPGWTHWLEQRGWHHGPAEAVGVATAAFLCTTPVIVAMTGHVGVLAILANVLVEPTVAPITVLGTGAAVLCCCWIPAAEVVLRLTTLPLWWLLFVSRVGARSGAAVEVPGGAGAGAVAAAVVAVVIAVMCWITRSSPHARDADYVPP